jgi:hypothetical protein
MTAKSTSSDKFGVKIALGMPKTNAKTAVEAGPDAAGAAISVTSSAFSGLAAVFFRQQLLDLDGAQGGRRGRAGHDDSTAGGKVRQHFPANAAGRDNLAVAVLLAGARMAERDDGLDSSLASTKRLTQSNSLGADGGASDIGIEMEAGINAAGSAPHGGGNMVAIFDIACGDEITRGGNQFLIGRRERSHVHVGFRGWLEKVIHAGILLAPLVAVKLYACSTQPCHDAESGICGSPSQ